MKEGPDIAKIASLIGDPARANILNALMGGKALTAGELAEEAGVTVQTASSHLAKLSDADLIWPRKQGRHRYYALRGYDVADVIETLGTFASRNGDTRTCTGPRDLEMRNARVCYDHMAGTKAVQLFDSLAERNFLTVNLDAVGLTPAGMEFMEKVGLNMTELTALRRPLCRVCLDWSVRRSHLSGALGAALLTKFLEDGWLRRNAESRSMVFSPDGLRRFDELFPVSRDIRV